jgi:hypothetical protein
MGTYLDSYFNNLSLSYNERELEIIMPKKSILLIALIFLISLQLPASDKFIDGDSLWIQTFTFDSISTRQAVFNFPENSDWNRVLMFYTLKCDEATPGDPYPCGEWDTNTYVRVYHETEQLDSLKHEHPLFKVKGKTPSKFAYRNSPVYDYVKGWSKSAASEPDDRYLRFESGDYLEIPPQALANADSALSICFWLRGDSDLQPQNDNFLEACLDGGRIINIHLPWGTGDVYWEAGGRLQGNNNRLQKYADPENWKGRWNHWAFTRNLQTGRTNIYINGELWHTAGNMFKPIGEVDQFILGANCNSNGGWYAGSLDDLQIYSSSLNERAIKKLMHNPPSPMSKDYENLELYYNFNDENFADIIDSSSNGLDAQAFGKPQSLPFGLLGWADSKPGAESIITIDSVMAQSVSMQIFADSLNPTELTSTFNVWSAQRQIFDRDGRLTETVSLDPDSVLQQSQYIWYDQARPKVERFEIERYITPYGKGLNLGEDGFTWIRDISDYAPLLSGAVDLAAGNGFELLDLRFLFISGKPARQTQNLQNIWGGGNFQYAKLSQDEQLPLSLLKINPASVSRIVRSRISGHGHYGPRNCCEWDAKEHGLTIAGIPRFNWIVWRNCGLNPLFPQGGTWQFDRAGWCPGTFVDFHDSDISSYTIGDSLVGINYTIENPDPENGEGDGVYYIEHQLFEFGAASRNYDICLDAVLAPSRSKEFRRYNPTSGSALIRIINRGAKNLTQVKFKYGLQSGKMSEFNWLGDLEFMQSTLVELPPCDWSEMAENSLFEVHAFKPNGKKDQFGNDNHLLVAVKKPLLFPASIIVEIKNPGFDRLEKNNWNIYGRNNNYNFERENFGPDSLYRDTLELENGAYVFEYNDLQEDGLIRHWWLRGSDPERIGENGRVRILAMDEEVLLDLGYDFAEGRKIGFFVGQIK